MEENRVLNWAGLCLGSEDEVYRLQLSLKVVALDIFKFIITLEINSVFRSCARRRVLNR